MADTILCTMGNLFMCADAFVALREQKMSLRTSMQVNRIARAMKSEYEILNEIKNDIIEEFRDTEAEPSEDGSVKVNNTPELQEKWNELMTTGVMLNTRPLRLSELENVELTPQELDLLDFLIEDDDEPTTK